MYMSSLHDLIMASLEALGDCNSVATCLCSEQVQRPLQMPVCAKASA